MVIVRPQGSAARVQERDMENVSLVFLRAITTPAKSKRPRKHCAYGAFRIAPERTFEPSIFVLYQLSYRSKAPGWIRTNNTAVIIGVTRLYAAPAKTPRGRTLGHGAFYVRRLEL